MLYGHIFGRGETVMGLDRIQLGQVADPGPGAGIVNGAFDLREDEGLTLTIAQLEVIANRGRTVAPTLDLGQAFER